MVRGVKEFVGKRLEEARLARGLTQTSLAQMVEKNSSTISGWESERQSPDAEALRALASVLGVRTTLFLKEQRQDPQAYFYRSNASITVLLQKKARARLKWAELMVDEMEEWIDFVDPQIPSADIDDLRQVDEKTIENCAAECRERWSLGEGPVDNVIASLEEAGCIVVREELGGLKMDGVSAWCSAGYRPFILLAEDKASAVRSRFDAAHELGHLVLHRRIDPEKLNKSEYAEMEQQAHRFASNFLMPEKPFLRDVNALDLDSFVSLKRKWKVSIGAMIMRCYQLDIISDEYRQRLFKYMSARGWRRSEPLDDVFAPEKPTAMATAIKLLIESGKYEREDLLDLFGLNSSDVEIMAALPKSYLKREAAPVVRLRESI